MPQLDSNAAFCTGTLMDETDNRMKSEGKGLFIIRNGKKIAKHEAGKWVPLLPGSPSATHPTVSRLKCRASPRGGWGELPDSTSLSDSSLLRFVPVQSGA